MHIFVPSCSLSFFIPYWRYISAEIKFGVFLENQGILFPYSGVPATRRAARLAAPCAARLKTLVERAREEQQGPQNIIGNSFITLNRDTAIFARSNFVFIPFAKSSTVSDPSSPKLKMRFSNSFMFSILSFVAFIRKLSMVLTTSAHVKSDRTYSPHSTVRHC